MDRLGSSEDLPSSPWAERFAVRGLSFIAQNTNHSLLAPEFPRVDDPKYYDRDPTAADGPPQNDADIDKLLWGEKIQRLDLHSLETWQLTALRRFVWFSPSSGFISGGHRPADAAAIAPNSVLSSSLSSSATRHSPLTGNRAFSGTIDRNKRSTSSGRRSSSINVGLRAFSGTLDTNERSSSSARRSSSLTAGLQVLSAAAKTNEEVNFSVYRRERIKVDETKWFSFWCRERWFDWIDVTPDFTQPAGKTWSVDDPQLWDLLSVILELAQRFLLALITDKNEGDYWDNHVDEFGAPPAADSAVLLSHPMERRLSQKRGESSCQWDVILSYTSEQWKERITKILRGIIWSFSRLHRAEGVTQCKPWIDDRHYPYSSVIMLDTTHLEAMLRPDLALEELCVLQVNCAITVIHELMHAINIGRYLDDNYVGNMLDQTRSGVQPVEPYLDGDGIPELGRCMEQLFFGGCLAYSPRSPATQWKSKPLAAVMRHWPWLEKSRHPPAPNSAFLKPGHTDIASHVPSTWCSKMLGEFFWEDPSFPRKSENFFHRNSIFLLESNSSDRSSGDPGKPTLQKLARLPRIYPEDRMALQAYAEKVKGLVMKYVICYTIAYVREHERPHNASDWVGSPWSFVLGRKSLYDFADTFLKKNILQCYATATWMTGRVRDDNLTQFMENMPVKDKRSHHWVWYVIGLLMMASMPIIYRGMEEKPPPRKAWFIQLIPSKHAAAAGHRHTVHADTVGLKDTPWDTIANRDFYNIIKRSRRIRRHTQLDYLDLVDDVIRLVASLNAIVPVQFLTAIMDARDALRTDRGKLQADYGDGHAARWASDWFFTIPAYDPTTCSFVNGQWQEQARTPPYS
ncbi:hypothetical protein F5Y10DRAFT_290766 [Nemania abortiva]|nr:hypothetical protein F5Y10DRAFT_290766 [Nemania abortiva]